MPSIPHLVILFTRYPHPGKCKSRLAPALGMNGAMKIHKELVHHVLQQLDTHILQSGSELQIHYDGGTLQKMQTWLGATYSYCKQQGDSLGQRMSYAFAKSLPRKQSVLLIGSDCPAITATLLTEATNALSKKDMVIGPTHDGGYYLIGLTAKISNDKRSQLFRDIPWSTSDVLTKTMQRAEEQQLTSHRLPTLHDIDTPEDLKYFHHHPHA